jgi:alkanesulfonate monooxygenase SsuD/methylene tetrahydromethanopterin reductase-like flavin-dependent oxidoreductase (luciferase family)
VTDHHHDLLFGASVPPDARDHGAVLAAAEAADELGLDIVSFQDHPYQPGFLDAWTLLTYVAARTERVRLLPNVANVPLRPPAVLARSAAALDILSGGRVELGLGAGYFLDGIVAMGGPDRSMVEHVAALAEAIAVIRGLWSAGPPVTIHGSHYRLEAARPGPPPAHPIGIWLGAYRRRMLQLTGRAADGWIPSLGYAAPEDLTRMSRVIDAAAEEAGRDPGAIRRAFNVSGSFAPTASGFLQGPPATWAEQLSALALEVGISTFILGVSPGAVSDLRRFAEEVAPAVREAVASERERGRRAAAAPPEPEPAPVASVRPDPAASHAAREARRRAGEVEEISPVGRAGQHALLAIHDHLRQELARLVEVIGEVARGRVSAAEARSYLNRMTMRQNYWTLGAFCAAYCRVVSVHHAIEDEHLFPDLRAADQSLGPILERLREEHEGIAEVLAGIDAALVAMVEDDDRLDEARGAVDRLSDALLAHLRREEDQLLGPIGRLSIRV